MSTDPREVMDHSAMTWLQITVVTITIGLNALDGFDVLAISFALPGIAGEWGVDPAALGLVASMELIGMSLGSFLLGGMADKVGRRPSVLFCLLVMTLGMFMVTTAGSVFSLSFWRIITGLGIGGMLPAINALVAEFSNIRRRHLCISLMAIGYPVGGAVGGSVASMMLAGYDWRSVFYFGAAVTAFFIPMIIVFVPESVHWLTRKQPVNALEKINRTFKRLGHAVLDALPEVSPDVRKKSIGDIFSPGLMATTLIISSAYFLNLVTFYFIMKWVPKILVDMGFAASSASGVLGWANIGGTLGGATFGLFTLRFGLKKLAIGALTLAAVFVAIFGRTSADLATITMFCTIAGFFLNAGVISLIAIAAQAFPTHTRAFGTGFMIGVGRGGATLSPILAGLLFELGLALPSVAIVMAIGSLVGAIVLIFLKLQSEGPKIDKDTKESGMKASVA
ncbi:MAG: MFS transporter [Acidobacteria bacterium]|nr:MFS transporter [Acidobacteriota bacterium]